MRRLAYDYGGPPGEVLRVAEPAEPGGPSRGHVLVRTTALLPGNALQAHATRMTPDTPKLSDVSGWFDLEDVRSAAVVTGMPGRISTAVVTSGGEPRGE